MVCNVDFSRYSSQMTAELPCLGMEMERGELHFGFPGKDGNGMVLYFVRCAHCDVAQKLESKTAHQRTNAKAQTHTTRKVVEGTDSKMKAPSISEAQRVLAGFS